MNEMKPSESFIIYRSLGRRVLLLLLVLCCLSVVSCEKRDSSKSANGDTSKSSAPGAVRQINLSLTPDLNCEIRDGISAVNESTGELYVHCIDRGVGVINMSTMEVESIVPTENFKNNHVQAIDIDQGSNKVFVGQYINGSSNSKLVVIDGASHTISDTIDFIGFVLIVLCDSVRGEVHVMSNNMIRTYDVKTLAIKRTVPIADITKSGPKDAELRKSTGHIFVGMPRDKVREYDPQTGSLVREFNMPYFRGMAIDDAGGKIFVAKGGHPEGTLTIVDIDTGLVVETVPIGNYVDSIVYDASLDEVFVQDYNRNNLYVVDPGFGTVETQLKVQGLAMALDEARERVYVIDKIRNTIHKISGRSHSLEESMRTGLDVSSIAVNSQSNKIFVMENTGPELYTFDATSGELLGKIQVTFENSDRGFTIAAINESGDKVYIKGVNYFGIYDAGSALDFTKVVQKHVEDIEFDETKQELYYSAHNTIFHYNENKTPKTSSFQYSDYLTILNIELDASKNRLYGIFHRRSPTGVYERGVFSSSTKDGSVIRERVFKNYPYNIIVDPGLDTIAVITSAGTLSGLLMEILDNDTFEPVKTAISIKRSSGVALNSKKHWLYVSDYRNGRVTVLDVRKGTEVKSIATGRHPTSVAVDSSTGTAYVLNKDEASITIIN